MNSTRSTLRAIFPTLCALLIVLAAGLLSQAGKRGRGATDRAKAPAATTPASPIGIPPSPLPPAEKPKEVPAAFAAKSKTFDTFQARPFAVVKSSGAHGWTAEDGKTPDAILDLAHNELEVDRLMAENARIKRRQLVYRKETVPMLLQRATDAEPLRSFMLPGLDGREVEVEVTEVRLNGPAGSVLGRIKGQFNSQVSVGFSNGCEFFTVSAPDEGLFLMADAREPGEVMVKEIDPATYSPLPLGEPIRRTSTATPRPR